MSKENVKPIDKIMIDNTKYSASDIPKNPTQNRDASSKNGDLSNKSAINTNSSKTPENKNFNKYIPVNDLVNKIKSSAPTPKNKNFNIDAFDINKDISNSVEINSKIPSNKKFNENGKKLNSKLYKKTTNKALNMEPTDVIIVNSPKVDLMVVNNKTNPYKMNISDVKEKVLMESNMQDPNMFSLDLSNVYMDKASLKFAINANGESVVVEMMYPNSNGNLSIRMETGNSEFLDEISVDSDEYANISKYITKNANELVSRISKIKDDAFSELGDYIGSGYNDQDMAYGNIPGNEMVKGNVLPGVKAESINSRLKPFRVLLEADEDEDEDVVAIDEEELGAGDVNAADDIDFEGGEGGELDFSGGFGDIFGGGDDMGDTDFSVASEPEESPGISPEDEPETITFDEYTDWSTLALNSMQELVAKFETERQKKSGAPPKSESEILNGSVGLRQKQVTHKEIIDSFKAVYPEVEELNLTLDEWDDIKEKLELDFDSFDAYLAELVESKRGAEIDVRTLNNDMFEEFPEENMEEDDGGFSMEEFDQEFSDVDLESSDTEDSDDFSFDLDSGLDFNEIEPDEEEEEE